MDSFTSEALVAVYGNYPEVRVTNIYGQGVAYEKIIETGHFTVSNYYCIPTIFIVKYNLLSMFMMPQKTGSRKLTSGRKLYYTKTIFITTTKIGT